MSKMIDIALGRKVSKSTMNGWIANHYGYAVQSLRRCDSLLDKHDKGKNTVLDEASGIIRDMGLLIEDIGADYPAMTHRGVCRLLY